MTYGVGGEESAQNRVRKPTEKWPAGIPGLDRRILLKWVTKSAQDSVD